MRKFLPWVIPVIGGLIYGLAVLLHKFVSVEFVGVLVLLCFVVLPLIAYSLGIINWKNSIHSKIGTILSLGMILFITILFISKEYW